MMGTSTLSIRLDTDLKDRLGRIAKKTDSNPNRLVVSAIENFVADQEYQEHRTLEAIAQAERGETVSTDAVRSWVKSWGTSNPLPRPKP